MKKTIVFLVLAVFLNDIYAQVNSREHYIHESVFVSTMSSILNGNVKGYQYAVGDEDGLLFRRNAGVAREAADNNGITRFWNNNHQMAMASVSKMVCTVTIMDILESISVSGAPSLNDKLNLKLEDYIPWRWRALIDGTEDDITMRHLLNHHSGFPDGSSVTPRTVLSLTMNQALPDDFDYENVNFELAGFMIIYMANPSIMGFYEQQLLTASTALYDVTFANVIQGLYQSYVQNNILAPAGIVADCARNVSDPTTTDVYRYGSATDNTGSNFGLTTTCMYNGWIFSATDMISFMQKWSNPSLAGNILSQASVNFINDFPAAGTTTPLGWFRTADCYQNMIQGYAHGGILWTCPQSSVNCEVYTSALVLLEDNVYMGINVNSNAQTGNRVNRTQDLRAAYDAAVCAPSIFISDLNKKKFHSAETSINSTLDLNVNSNQTVVLKAGEYVRLSPGFHARSGSLVKAYIADCSSFITEVH